MFLIGKINPAKLLNFPEIDVFVLVACPENSLLDSKVLFKPVVSETETAGQMGVWMCGCGGTDTSEQREKYRLQLVTGGSRQPFLISHNRIHL